MARRLLIGATGGLVGLVAAEGQEEKGLAGGQGLDHGAVPTVTTAAWGSSRAWMRCVGKGLDNPRRDRARVLVASRSGGALDMK